MDIFQHPDSGEIARYLVSGFSAVATDMVIYWLFLPVFGPNVAKAISFVSGTVVSYNLNKHWTWKQRKHSWSEVSRFATLYSGAFVANLSVNQFLLSAAIDSAMPQLVPLKFQLGWLTATGTSTVINYLGQRFWVFRNRPSTNVNNADSEADPPGQGQLENR